MKKLLNDVKTASGIFMDIRKARKEGAEVKVRKVRSLPVFSVGLGILDTVEGCTLWNRNKEVFGEIQGAFDALPEEERKKQTSAPKDGEFVERAYFWKTLISSALPPEQTRKAMISILEWYIHIKRRRNV